MSVRVEWMERLWVRQLHRRFFKMDPEDAHRKAIELMAWVEQNAMLLEMLRLASRARYLNKPCAVGGVTWRNPFGVPAGLDKHAEAIPFFNALGVGSLELGTILPRPQEGNARPRIFRYPDDEALVNRMGFNSCGAQEARDRVKRCHRVHRITMPLGFSIGKNLDTPLERAVDDYEEAFRILLEVIRPGLDFVSINISSPNTEGLRELIKQFPDFMRSLIHRLTKIAHHEGKRLPPLAVKLSPDNWESDDQFDGVARVLDDLRIQAAIMGNTTTDEDLKRSCGAVNQKGDPEQGGLSGQLVFDRSLKCQKRLHAAKLRCGGRFDIIGCGGIDSAKAALERRRHGAVAVQSYTPLIYHGPALMHRILEAWEQPSGSKEATI